MPKVCPDCDSTMLPADEMDCEKANFVCPDCAPDFVLAHSTTFSDIEPEVYE